MSKSQMTGRERVLSAVRRQDVDYVPCSPRFNPLHERQRAGYKYQFPWEPADIERQVEYCVQELGVDPVIRFYLSNYHKISGVTSRVWEEDGIVHKVWSTPSGELHASVRNDEKWIYGQDIPFYHDFTGHYVEPWLKTRSDLECLRHILQPAGDAEIEKLRTRFESLRKLADRFQLAIAADVGTGLTGAMELAEATALCKMVIDEPDLVDDYLEMEHQKNLKHMQIVLDMGVDIVQRNGFYETCDFYSPQMLEKFLGRRLREEISLVHDAGAPIVYTLHTGVPPMLDYLAGLDFDAIYGLDTAFQGIDLSAVFNKLGHKTSFWTGPSNTFHMFSDNPEVVRQSVRTVFEAFGKRGLLITACPSSHSIMPWENTLAMIDEWKKLR